MKLELWLPVKPYHVNQVFGNNPLNADGTPYYARFLDRFGNPEKGHMGLDLMAAHATPLYAPCDGIAWYVADEHGGDGIYIQAGPFDYKDTEAWFVINLWHLCSKDDPQYHPLIPTDGTRVPVKRGQLIGYTDNSGAPFESSGDHLHIGLVPTDQSGNPFEPRNGFNGCIDPAPYFNTFFAQDADATIQNLETQISLLTKVVNFLKALLSKK